MQPGPSVTQLLAITAVTLFVLVALIYTFQAKPEWFPSETMEGLPPPA